MQFAVSVHRAAEDYLEAMLMMKEQHGYVRSIDVAEHLGVTKPSVTYATKQLKQNGFITMDRDGLITLTESGMEIADRIYTRHKTLTESLCGSASMKRPRGRTPARSSMT